MDAETKHYLDGMLAEILTAMKAGFSRLERRMEAVEQRLDALEQRMDALEQRMDALERRMDAFEQRLAAMELMAAWTPWTAGSRTSRSTCSVSTPASTTSPARCASASGS